MCRRPGEVVLSPVLGAVAKLPGRRTAATRFQQRGHRHRSQTRDSFGSQRALLYVGVTNLGGQGTVQRVLRVRPVRSTHVRLVELEWTAGRIGVSHFSVPVVVFVETVATGRLRARGTVRLAALLTPQLARIAGATGKQVQRIAGRVGSRRLPSPACLRRTHVPGSGP